jgi:hypothetical protein
MAHLVCRRGKYWSIEESFRENGKVKKRVLKYLGARRSDDPQIRMQQMLDTAERRGAEIDEAQRQLYGETSAERQERVREEAKFSQEKFLEATRSASADSMQAPVAESSDEPATADAGSGEPGVSDEP